MKTELWLGEPAQELNCPACNKLSTRGTSACGRCGCDLKALWTILDGAVWHLAEACDALHQRDANRALAHADQSWRLIHNPLSAAAGALAAVLTGRLDVVELWRNRCRDVTPS